MTGVSLSKVTPIIPNATLQGALADGRAIVSGWEILPGKDTRSFGVIGTDGVRCIHRERGATLGNSLIVTDGTRVALVARDQLLLWDSVDRRPRRIPIRGRTKDAYVLSACLVPGENALWMILSDPFWVVVGRYVALVTWKGATARYARIQQPFPYRPYNHSGVLSVAIGAASSRGAWLYAEDQNKRAFLRRIATRTQPAVNVPKGEPVFDPIVQALAVTPKNRATATVVDGAGQARGRIKLPPGAQLAAMCGRHRWAKTSSAFVRVDATEDLPSLASATREATTAAAARPLRVRERVVGWALNEAADLKKPGPVVEMEIGEDVLVFRKSSGGKMRFFFDFLLRAIRGVTWKPAPGDRVLMEIETPSGRTRALCTESFAGLLRTCVADARAR